MLFLLASVSTWLFIEIIASSCLVVLNIIIPVLMIFSSFRNVANFYLSSTALSSSLINGLYLFYLIQTYHSKILSEVNCRAIYYLHSSCIVILAYTVVAIHANFILCLFPTPSHKHHSSLTNLQSCGLCIRRYFRRFCFCFVICVWSFSFTATIPLLYSIDSNEKIPKPVYCPGTKEISYLEEWFDRNRFIQTVLFNLIPLLINIFLSLIALLKLTYDSLVYLYLRSKRSKLSKCCRKSSQRQQPTSNFIPLLSPVGANGNNNHGNNANLTEIIEARRLTNETVASLSSSSSSSSSDFIIESCGKCLSKSFVRLLLVLSSCLLACLYPIVMRFYLIYFSVLVPMIFAVLNYSVGQFISMPQQTNVDENATMGVVSQSTVPVNAKPIINQDVQCEFHIKIPVESQIIDSSQEILALKSSSVKSLRNEQEELLVTSSNSSATLSTDPGHQHRASVGDKQRYFVNQLYETSSTML